MAIGKTNGQTSGGKIELFWTNPNPDAYLTTLTLPITDKNCKGLIIDCKRTNNAPNTSFIRNFVQMNDSSVLAGYDGSAIENGYRTASLTPTQLTISNSTVATYTSAYIIPINIYSIT